MNILEAFVMKYGQLIILILGLPCSNKSEIAKEFEIDLKLSILNINDYLIENKFKEIEVDNKKFKIYEDTMNYDWDKFNDDVDKLKSKGVIIYGNYIDKLKIKFNIDFSFFYSLNITLCKKILIEKKLVNLNNSEEEIIFFDKIFNPKYKELKTLIKFNKFYNIKESTVFSDFYDDNFDLLMKLIKAKL